MCEQASFTLLFLFPAAILQVFDVVALDRFLKLIQRSSTVLLLKAFIYIVWYTHVLRFPGNHQPHGPVTQAQSVKPCCAAEQFQSGIQGFY